MNRSLLVLGRGDSPETDKSRRRVVTYALESGFEVQALDYHELGQLHPFKQEMVNILPFFPYAFWNQNCEVPEDTRLYGTSRKAYLTFQNFFLSIQEELGQRLSGHTIVPVIPLDYAALDRDKLQTVRILQR